MGFLRDLFGKKQPDPTPRDKEKPAASYDVILRKADDPLVIIDPQSIVAAFVAVTLADAGHLEAAEKTVAQMNKFCQPRLWSVSFTTKFGAFACSASTDGLPDVKAIVPALERQGITQPFSLVVNTMDVSFDGGTTKSKVLAGFAFRESLHRFLFPGNDACIPG